MKLTTPVMLLVVSGILSYSAKAETSLTIDPGAALIVVDLQKSILSRPTAHPIDPIVQRAATLAEAFRRRGFPVVFVNSMAQPPGRTQQQHRSEGQPAADRADLIPQLGRQPGDHFVSKVGWSAFARTDLDAYLKKSAVTQVVILGYSTTVAIESTARQAYDSGYNVLLVSDAITDTNADAHEKSFSLTFPRLGETAKTQQIVDRLGSP